MKRITLTLFSIALLAISACKKHGNCTDSAIIIDGGPSADQALCGWCIKVGNNYFHPTSLDSAYLHDGLKVRLSYQVVTDTVVRCTWVLENEFPMADITCIEKAD